MPPTRTAGAGDNGDWRKILFLIGAVGVAGTGYKLVKGRKIGAWELLSALAFVLSLLGDK
jgi:hypothetical protein